jgi:hypothetical protein
MKHDVVVLPFRKAGHKSPVAACANGEFEVAPFSTASTAPIYASIARVDINAMSVAIALRYLSGRVRVSMRTKR